MSVYKLTNLISLGSRRALTCVAVAITAVLCLKFEVELVVVLTVATCVSEVVRSMLSSTRVPSAAAGA